MTDTNGSLISGQAYHYSPFGEAIDHPAQPEAAHLFTGEYYDGDLSLYYLRARLYDPCLGRFTSCDPVEDHANKLHRYVYCGNDAVNRVDWSGEASLIEITCVAGIIGIISGIIGFAKSWSDTKDFSSSIKLSLAYALIGVVSGAISMVYPRFALAAIKALISIWLSTVKSVSELILKYVVELCLGIIIVLIGGGIAQIHAGPWKEGGSVIFKALASGIGAAIFGFICGVARYLHIWFETITGLREPPSRLDVVGSVSTAAFMGATFHFVGAASPTSTVAGKVVQKSFFSGIGLFIGRAVDWCITGFEDTIASYFDETPVQWNWSVGLIENYEGEYYE